MTGPGIDSVWTGPERDASGGAVWRLPGTDWLIHQHKTSGIALYLSPQGVERRLVSAGFDSIEAARDYVRRNAGFFRGAAG